MSNNDPTLRILLVEDDEDDYLITRDLLSDASPVATHLVWRDSVEGGIQALVNDPFDVALVDLRLGPDSGLALIQQAHSKGVTTPFILLTGQGDEELDVRAVELGAADYLTKGRIAGHTLIRSIRYAIDRAAANRSLAHSEAHYRLLFENNPVPMCLVDPDTDRVETMNRAARQLYGYVERELTGLCWNSLQAREQDTSVSLEGVFLREGSALEQHQTRDGDRLFVEVLSEHVLINHREMMLRMLSDLTAQMANNRKMRLLQRCIESSSNGILVCDALQPDLPIIYINPTFERMTGYTMDEVVGRNCRFLQGTIPDPDNAHALADIREALANGHEVSAVLRNYRKDGTPFWNDLYISPMRNDRGQVTHFVGVQNDISERKSVESQLAYNTSHDVLTGLPNRALLEDRLTQACRLAHRYGRKVGVVFIDLDGFKLINDSLGLRVGDQVLVEVALRLKNIVRSGDTVARMSGDEFVLVLPDLRHTNDIIAIVEKIMARLAMPYQRNEENLHLTASVGIATTDGTIQNPLALIQQADLAMFSAKQLGRNTYQWFSEELNVSANYRVKLRNELQDAIENDKLSIYYQPVVDSRTGHARSVEALVRWHHPTRGLVSPGDFIPLAEETGQIIALGERVLKRACLDMVELHSAGFGDCRVAVNVSPIQVRKQGFMDTVQQALTQSGLPAHALELEIVESAVLHDTDQVIETLHNLRELGVRIAIDDFGTGFSSLSYIKLLPATKLKIDRSFVQDVIRNRSDAAITQGIISMAHHLSLEVVAEGVETEAHAAFLAKHNCDLLQGFVFAKPMPFNELKQYMNNQSVYPPKSAERDTNQEKTLLLLDDEENILRALTRVFRRDRYRILSTTSISEAFQLLAENHVQVIISDQRMPEMSGTEFFSQVKAIHPDTVRIVLSGYTDLKSVTDAINEGAIYKFLTKPWDDKQIREHIQQAFQYHAAMRTS